ncbi:hypothetical protein ACETK8_02330 [Brevundimonas staleyi]|uniref:Argininosuccinate lyase n=1 Tax=Brevundimonas staleyi TaxID=74326 RepID=A0ABW0FTM7_9CAUL
MKAFVTGAIAALTLLAGASAASAAEPVRQADGDYYTFDLVNQSDYTILTFQTGEPGGTWSRDWMPTRVLEAHDDVAMRFYDSDDACDYYVKIVFTDGDEWTERLDFCDLEYVVVTNDGIYGTNGD